MYEEENEKRYRKIVSSLFGAKEVEPMQIIHSGKDDPSLLLELAYRVKELFKPIFARSKRETIETARIRRENRARAIEDMKERVEARFIRARRRSPGKRVSRFVSTSDLDMNALLAGPSKVGERLNFAHTGQLNADRKLMKKEVKKKIKEKKKVLKKSKKKEISLEMLERIDAEIAELEGRI